MSTQYVNQFPAIHPSHVLLVLQPDEEYEFLPQRRKLISFDEMKRKVLEDGESIHITCTSNDHTIVTGEVRFTPETDEYSPVVITLPKNENIIPPMFFDLTVDQKNPQEAKTISVHEEPVTKYLALYMPLVQY